MRILVWLSWWVDSAVSAGLLLEQWHEVVGGFMINYIADEWDCPTETDLMEAKKVATHLWIELYTFDYREEYERRIIAYIYSEYEKWRTPNPDVFCNNLIKFDIFMEEALGLWFDAIATGHYAQIKHVDTEYILKKWIDPEKDQSYFLSRLTEYQRSHAIFPIGHLKKSEVRVIAERMSLPNAKRKDSQWLCFIGKVSMKEFLEKRISKKPGNILDMNGKIIGEHDGAFSYTIGQRKWIGVGGGPARFVVEKNVKNNTITVGWDEDIELYKNTLIATEWLWSSKNPPPLPYVGKWKIRYRQEDQDVTIDSWDNNCVHVTFLHPQRAITNGQIFTLYSPDGFLLWSGIIE